MLGRHNIVYTPIVSVNSSSSGHNRYHPKLRRWPMILQSNHQRRRLRPHPFQLLLLVPPRTIEHAPSSRFKNHNCHFHWLDGVWTIDTEQRADRTLGRPFSSCTPSLVQTATLLPQVPPLKLLPLSQLHPCRAALSRPIFASPASIRAIPTISG